MAAISSMEANRFELKVDALTGEVKLKDKCDVKNFKRMYNSKVYDEVHRTLRIGAREQLENDVRAMVANHISEISGKPVETFSDFTNSAINLMASDVIRAAVREVTNELVAQFTAELEAVGEITFYWLTSAQKYENIGRINKLMEVAPVAAERVIGMAGGAVLGMVWWHIKDSIGTCFDRIDSISNW